ncbi:MAG: heparan-alpha-glucosaminide N-acetyltransferase [Verrucomicrobiales bacterium]|jgi:heparan-alpha-glucosaminide N-acetyltransferase
MNSKPQLKKTQPIAVKSLSLGPKSSPDQFVKQRLKSLDAYRGLIMVSLAFVGFGMADVAKLHLVTDPSSSFWQGLHFHFTHVQWAGCSYWDLIQPSFMFMVGVSMAYSYVQREKKGHSYGKMLRHAMIRSLALVLLGVFLSSNSSDTTNWSFMNVLSQIGLGYTFLFLLWRRQFATQVATAAVLLVGTWLLYFAFPNTGVAPEAGAAQIGVSAEWAAENLEGIDAVWHKNANVGHAVDRWFLNLFPRESEFEFNRGGYQTINFIPSLATMLFGLICGELLRSKRRSSMKLLFLIVGGLAAIAVGFVLDWSGICPSIKRIWTPSWALFSTGWCCLILAALYLVIDVIGFQRWAFPLYVVGMNSIVVYCMGQLLKPWTRDALQTHFGQNLFDVLGAQWQPFTYHTLVGLSFWLFCYWLYRQKLFVRI